MASSKALRQSKTHAYVPLQDKESLEKSLQVPARPRRYPSPTFLASVACMVAAVLLVASASLSLRQNSSPYSAPHQTCDSPRQRREWRSLDDGERESYVNAVKCLSSKPSRLGINGTLHDDFSYVHVWHGHDSHDGAAFFSYHRWLLHLYESALKDECGYGGTMVYWDWSLDWRDPYAAPVFDAITGFGGEGSKSEPGFRGGCMDTGPFAGYVVPFLETINRPHCLSREFMRDEANLTHWAEMWHPSHLEEILSEDDFGVYRHRIEDGPHVALPKMLHGDFSTRHAPVDPLFMLHHAQLDRLYWQWQQRAPQRRLHDYGGPRMETDRHKLASMNDVLFFGAIGPSATVRRTMDTKSGGLCYSYS